MTQVVGMDTEIYQRKTCRYCDRVLPEPFLKLGSLPLANSFLTQEELTRPEFVCPLNLCYCQNCSLVQLSHTVPPDLMFSNYLYVSSTTQTLRNHFAFYAQEVKKRLNLSTAKPLAVDIGSNDGLLVECFQKEGFQAVGVEPARNLSDLTNQKGLLTINRYFDEATAREIIDRFGKAGTITANNVFAHIDDIHSVCRNVAQLLHEGGIFVIEFPYLPTMIQNMLFDMIYHEHLCYISVHALNFLLKQHRLKIFDISYVSSHGGSLRVSVEMESGPYDVSKAVDAHLTRESKEGYLSMKTYVGFTESVAKVKDGILRHISDIKRARKSVSGYGAPAKSNTLICYCGLSHQDIQFIVDDNPLKQNRFTPGSKIPVVPSDYLNEHPTDYVVVFAWNFAPEIMRKLSHLRKRGIKVIVPLPSPKIV